MSCTEGRGVGIELHSRTNTSSAAGGCLRKLPHAVVDPVQVQREVRKHMILENFAIKL
jgi:hypothetical protein